MEESPNGVTGFVPAFKRLYTQWEPDHVACESFNLRPGNKFLPDLSSVECIGWLKGEGLRVGYARPVQHKTLVKDSTLNPLMKAGKFPVGAGHTRDALRVGVWYAAKVLKHRPTLELLQPRESN